MEKTELSAVRRREMIVSKLKELKQISVKELSSGFGVSDMTIRRDLHRLEEQGLVTVHYGGASIRSSTRDFPSFTERQDKLYHHKLAIARTAASFLKSGDVVFLDTSTTILLMLRYLPELPLTIVTNSLPVMEQTFPLPHVTLYIAPGCYKEQYGRPLDSSTAEYLRRFHYDKAFFGASAVDAAFGASATREIEAAVKRIVSANAEENYLLCDHTKFGKKNLIHYNDVCDYRLIFTDPELDFDTQARTAQNGGKLYLCE